MPKVKKYNYVHDRLVATPGLDIINFGTALAEILFHNYHPYLTKKNEEEVRRQLLSGYMVNTNDHMYHIINPINDVLDNIDDYVNLDDYNEEE